MLKENKLGLFTENDLTQIKLNIQEEEDNVLAAKKSSGKGLLYFSAATGTAGAAMIAAGIALSA